MALPAYTFNGRSKPSGDASQVTDSLQATEGPSQSKGKERQATHHQLLEPTSSEHVTTALLCYLDILCRRQMGDQMVDIDTEGDAYGMPRLPTVSPRIKNTTAKDDMS